MNVGKRTADPLADPPHPNATVSRYLKLFIGQRCHLLDRIEVLVPDRGGYVAWFFDASFLQVLLEARLSVARDELGGCTNFPSEPRSS